MTTADIFAGVKVWDASWVGVGPLTARYLGDYGATVVRTESATRPDMLRTMPPFRDGIPGLNRSQFFAEYNASKLGLGLNFKAEHGQELAIELATWADVMIESFSPGVLEGLGLAYEDLRRHNPSLVMLSTSMNGQTGPHREFAGFGTIMTAQAGFCEVSGWPDRGPGSPYGPYTDFICQRFTTTALIAAIDHRRRTGVGQHIDVAQYEAALQMLAPALLDYEVNGRVATRAGNRSESAAPHGVYPCLQEGPRERWVAISVETQAQWEHLKEVVGQPWTSDPRFETAHGRLANRAELDAHLTSWTRVQHSLTVFRLLQPVVCAAPVQDAADLHADPQVLYRGYFRELNHTEMGLTVYEGSQARLSRTQPHVRKAAPCLGEDSEFVLKTLLGLSEERVAELVRSGAVEVAGSREQHSGSS